MIRKGIVAKNIVEIIIAILCVLLVLGVVQKVFGNQEKKSIENLLDEIVGIAKNLKDGQEYKHTIPGLGKGYLMGFDSDDKETPEKCFFESCICVCPEANSKSCQTEGICKPIDVENIDIISSYPDFWENDVTRYGNAILSCISLVQGFVPVAVEKTQDGLQISFQGKEDPYPPSEPASLYGIRCNILSYTDKGFYGGSL